MVIAGSGRDPMTTREIKIPGPDHPITITPATKTVRVTVAGVIIAQSAHALVLEEKGYPPVYYIPREDADMSQLVRTTHYSYCPCARIYGAGSALCRMYWIRS
jgi:uncharacterized protein (DUF427 family)